MSEHQTISIDQVAELLIKINRDFKAWDLNGQNPKELKILLVQNIDNYLLISNSSTPSEMGLWVEEHEYISRFFKFMHNLSKD